MLSQFEMLIQDRLNGAESVCKETHQRYLQAMRRGNRHAIAIARKDLLAANKAFDTVFDEWVRIMPDPPLSGE